MTRWRVLAALVLLATVGAPAVMPFLELLTHTQGWRAWTESPRLLGLAANTLGLVAGTLALAMPVGMVGAVLLYRTDLPLRRWLRFLTLSTLFVPLPLFTSAWQAALGTGGWLPVAVWNKPLPGDPNIGVTGVVWKPWAQGLAPAIWVHAVAGLPWVIVLVGQGLCWVERELEEDALTVTSPWWVLWKVTLPRCRAAIFAAGLWVALSTTTEITVTDAMQVRTFAEEVYTQLVAGDRAALAHAVAVSLPAVVLTFGLVLWATRGWERNLPPLEVLTAPPRLLRLGTARWRCLATALLVVALLLGVPLVSLLWKAGLGGNPQAWSAHIALDHLSSVLRVRGWMVVESLLLAALLGTLAGGCGLVLCWLAVDSRWFQVALFSLLALVWSLSGPVVGLGLKEVIASIHFYPLALALYYGPSPLPVLWAQWMRFLPCAVAVLWPVVRLLPAELRDAARVDGARPRQELWYVVRPLTLVACSWAAFAVAVLSLGEISASKLVETPGSRTFAHEVFDQMHYGVTNDLAALCLLLLAIVLLGGSLAFLWSGRGWVADRLQE